MILTQKGIALNTRVSTRDSKKKCFGTRTGKEDLSYCAILKCITNGGQMIGRMITQFDNANLMEINNYELDLNVGLNVTEGFRLALRCLVQLQVHEKGVEREEA